jgi:hypothetical protein
MFQRAERKKAKLRLALCGPSGSGKTMSALLIAAGLGGRIAVIDTERGSAELYADAPGIPEYDVCQITPPYLPERYVQAIHEAEKLGYDNIIVDSLSHAWAGTGGLLEEVDKRKGKGNDFTAWRDITPMHNALVDAMLQSSSHIIATMRTKTAYDMVKDEKTGKVKPVKVGLAPVQRDGMEYEFTVVLDLDIDKHVATASKDRTDMFDGRYTIPTEQTGAELRAWLETGKEPFNRDKAIEQINACEDLESLEKLYKEIIKDAGQHTKEINLATKDRKKALLEQSAQPESTQEPQKEPVADKATTDQITALQAHYSHLGMTRDQRLGDVSMFLGRDINSFSDLTKAEAHELLDTMKVQR